MPLFDPARRRWLIRGVAATSALAGLTVAAGAREASRVRLREWDVPVRDLPAAFEGSRVAVLADFHLGPFVTRAFVRRVVELTNALAPDLVLMPGDFAHNGHSAREQLPPCLAELSRLRAPLGLFAVPGNHDMLEGGRVYRELVAPTPIVDLTNRNQCVTRAGAKLWLAGVDDFWWGKPDLGAALRSVPAGAAVILLCHNPDFLEAKPDARVGLAVCGHTHGGQVYLPGLGYRFNPSRHGDKYRYGLVDAPGHPTYVTSGLGEAGAPLRLGVPPEVAILTLTHK